MLKVKPVYGMYFRAVGLLLSSIRAEDPVVFFEPKALYRASVGEVGK